MVFHPSSLSPLRLRVLETLFSKSLNHQRIIQHYPSSLHSYFWETRVVLPACPLPQSVFRLRRFPILNASLGASGTFWLYGGI